MTFIYEIKIGHLFIIITSTPFPLTYTVKILILMITFTLDKKVIGVFIEIRKKNPLSLRKKEGINEKIQRDFLECFRSINFT